MKKTAKRRRTKQQVKEDRENARRRDIEVQAKLQKYEALHDQFLAIQEKVNRDDLIQAQVNNLFKQGLLEADEEGNITINGQNMLEFHDFQENRDEIIEG